MFRTASQTPWDEELQRESGAQKERNRPSGSPWRNTPPLTDASPTEGFRGTPQYQSSAHDRALRCPQGRKKFWNACVDKQADGENVASFREEPGSRSPPSADSPSPAQQYNPATPLPSGLALSFSPASPATTAQDDEVGPDDTEHGIRQRLGLCFRGCCAALVCVAVFCSTAT